MHKVRENVETHETYDTKKHLEVIKQGSFDLYENEYAVIKDSLELPIQFLQLGEIEQQLVLLYIDDEFVEPISGKKTKNNSFISFLVALNKPHLIEKLYEKYQVLDGWTKDGKPLYKEMVRPNPKEQQLRNKLLVQKSAVWNKSNLKKVCETMRTIVANDGFKDTELIKQKTIDDALSDEKTSYTMRNRSLAAEITGLKKQSGSIHINVFEKGGGKEATRNVIEATGQESFNLIPEGIEND